MARVTTKTGVANLALSLIKNDQVTSIDPPDRGSKAAKAAALWYDDARREVLSEHDWDFAKKRVNLSAGTPPAFGWAASYQLPSDCLRISTIGDEANPWTSQYFRIEGQYILCNESGPIQLCYISDIDDITKFTPKFLVAFAKKLGSYISAVLTGSLNMMQGLGDEATDTLSDAKSLDSQQNPPVRVQRSRWAAAKQRGHTERTY